MVQLIDKRDVLSELISPRRDIEKPVYNWHSFKHSYSKDLVDIIIREFKLKKGAWVLDPFCGGGTTLLACKELGINSRGLDILPFSVFLTNVKAQHYDPNRLMKIRKKYRLNQKIRLEIPSLNNIPIARKAFSPTVKNELIKIKQWIKKIDDPKSRDFYNLAFLSILETVSKTCKAGGFLRLRDNRIRANKISSKFLSRVNAMIDDVRNFSENLKSNNVSTFAILGDARELDFAEKYDAVITSPPYPNRHDYTRIYSLEMLFDFVESNDDLKSIRYETLRSHVEAKKKYACIDYKKPRRISRLIQKIERNGTNNPMVMEMLEGYFEDMYLALKQISMRLRGKGKVAMVISNVRFAGINIPVDEILSEIGEQVGLESKAIWIARFRGNSPQQMKTYNRMPSRESIVIWTKGSKGTYVN